MGAIGFIVAVIGLLIGAYIHKGEKKAEVCELCGGKGYIEYIVKLNQTLTLNGIERDDFDGASCPHCGLKMKF